MADPSVPDDLYLIVGAQAVSGWTSVQVRRGIEQVPASFDIELTESYPGKQQLVVHPGDACQIRLGKDLVLTGYVDRYSADINASQHSIKVSGRSKSEDLVDCSATIGNYEINGAKVSDILQTLCKPFGIDRKMFLTADQNIVIPKLRVTPSQMVWQVIRHVCGYCQILAYDDPSGALVLGPVGTDKHASGLAEGGNIESANITWATDQRFSRLAIMLVSPNSVKERPQAGTRIGDHIFTADDKGISRYRPLTIVSEQGQPGTAEIAQQRAQWEVNRRYGRAQSATLTVDSWRDKDGALWGPNKMVSFHLPSLHLSEDWLIAAVTYRRDGSGTHADLTLMPPAAFAPEPITQKTFDWQVDPPTPGGYSTSSSGANK